MTTTLLVLEQRISEQMGDYLSFDTTTTIPGSAVTITSTTLNSYDGGRDDYFNDWWVYITEGVNSGVLRQVSDYATTGGILTVRGANLAAEAGAVTCILHRYDRTLFTNAINDALRETTSALHRPLEDRSLVTGNILPDNSFEEWSSSSAMTYFTTSNATVARTSTAALIRGKLGSYSMKVNASAANGYAYISSNTYPRLLDLMGQTISFKCWAYPEDTANDAYLVIYTIKADGTAQTLTSSTTNPLAKFTLLELEDQAINDDITEIQFRFKVATNGTDVYFDSARVNGIDILEYLLPSRFANGGISQVFVQASGNQDDACDDLVPQYWNELIGWEVIEDGTYSYLKLPYAYGADRQIRLIGYAPLETLTADTDTISLDGESINLLIAYAKYKLYQAIEPPVATADVRRYESGSIKAYNEYLRLLPRLRKSKPSMSMNIGVIK